MAMEEMSAVAGEQVDPAVVGEAVIPEGEEVLEPEDGTEEPVVAAAEPVEEFTGDHRTIPAAVRDLFKNPAGGKDAKAAWFERSAFREVFPDGPNQAKETMSMLAEMGGREGLDELRASDAQLREIDELLTSGDTKILERVQPEAVSKLAPEFMQKWNQVDPDGCNRTLCGVIANTFSQQVPGTDGNLAMNLTWAARLMQLGQPEEAAKILQQVQGWANNFGAIATAPVQKKPVDTSYIDKRAQELDSQAEGIFNQKYSSAVQELRSPIIDRELKPFLKGAELSPTKRTILMNEIARREKEIMESDTAFLRKVNGYGKDAKGLSARVAAFKYKLDSILPSVVQDSAREIVGSPVKPRPAAPAVVKPTPVQQTQKAAADAAASQDPKKAFLDSMFGAR